MSIITFKRLTEERKIACRLIDILLSLPNIDSGNYRTEFVECDQIACIESVNQEQNLNQLVSGVRHKAERTLRTVGLPKAPSESIKHKMSLFGHQMSLVDSTNSHWLSTKYHWLTCRSYKAVSLLCNHRFHRGRCSI